MQPPVPVQPPVPNPSFDHATVRLLATAVEAVDRAAMLFGTGLPTYDEATTARDSLEAIRNALATLEDAISGARHRRAMVESATLQAVRDSL